MTVKKRIAKKAAQSLLKVAENAAEMAVGAVGEALGNAL